jgi:hypothetical protein
MGWQTGWYCSKPGTPGARFSKSLAWPANSRWGNILEAMTNELKNEFPDCSLEFQPSPTIIVFEHVIRLILLLGIRWWMKSSSIFDDGYWSV